MTVWTDADFDRLSWHDNHVHGLHIREGEYGAGGLTLDIDYIVEWLCPVGEAVTFRLAPADLTFHDVTDLRIQVDYAVATAGTTPFSIAGIERMPVASGGYRWTIALSWPRGGITFHASGFRQILRAAAVVRSQQGLTAADRASMMVG
jgi:hypothetical protein